ncbi:helix-turn-helix domain-containing protein [Kribbella sp. NBC_00709]|uniref:ArsR/SmtB family transcription factor n=1 Tax=Kribbella sp. NBC_00709 TaxID=2975972 RepID=UPI002E2B6546|nr:helix-turn-helix domain-containing protein [Kribbella sp. NBC_00709]
MAIEPRSVLAPDLSMLSVTLQALLGDGKGIPKLLRLRLLAVMHTPAGRAALRPMVAPPGQRRQIPSAVAPLTPVSDLSMETQVDALRSNHNDQLRNNLVEIFGDRIPPVWRAAAEQPARWSRALGDALADVWSGPGRDAWSRSRAALDSELRRQESLVGRAATHTLLNTLSPRIRFDRGAFVLDERVKVPVGNRKIVLAPMISAPDSMVVENSDPVAIVVGYPLPGALASWSPAGLPVRESSDALATVIGHVRAEILRRLVLPMSMSQLAAELNCAPSTATHHCNTLESAGLVERIRQGKSILVRRTSRGASLVDIFT